MNTKLIEAARLALEALEYIDNNYMSLPAPATKAITALHAALADAALERMAENARELGLNYDQPAQNEPVCDQDPYLCWSVRCQLGKVCKNARNQQPAQDEPYLSKAYRLANELREHLSIAPAREPVIDKAAAVRIATALGWEPKRTWVGLTDDERTGLWEWVYYSQNEAPLTPFEFARAIEVKLKEKNT